jgi:hypothetical protein
MGLQLNLKAIFPKMNGGESYVFKTIVCNWTSGCNWWSMDYQISKTFVGK